MSNEENINIEFTAEEIEELLNTVVFCFDNIDDFAESQYIGEYDDKNLWIIHGKLSKGLNKYYYCDEE